MLIGKSPNHSVKPVKGGPGYGSMRVTQAARSRRSKVVSSIRRDSPIASSRMESGSSDNTAEGWPIHEHGSKRLSWLLRSAQFRLAQPHRDMG